MKNNIPASIADNEKSYLPEAYKEYSFKELGNWVHLLTKRAGHRSDQIKQKKDLDDAQAYLGMMQMKLDELRDQ